MEEHMGRMPDQKGDTHCKTFIELKQVALDVYGENICKMAVSPTSVHHRKQWRKIQQKQQDSTTYVSNVSYGIKQEPVTGCTAQSHENFPRDSTTYISNVSYGIKQEPVTGCIAQSNENFPRDSRLCTEAGYLYPVDDSQAYFHRQDSQDIYAEQPQTTDSPRYADTTKELVHNVENMKVTNSNGEVIVELYGYHYPIDVSAAIDINGAQRTDNKHVDFTHSLLSSPPRPESPVHMRSKSDNLYSDPCLHKSLKTKDTGKLKYRQKRMQRGCRLWEFIRDLLQNPLYNPSHIKWIDRSVGEFRLVKSNQIARMWGAKKNNECMTYEKLSRAMRYYYKREILSPVLGKRLVYRFGAKSYGW
ncbi:ETS-related transcription factor Elf-4-like [Mizuhopecten yessoensis]|nr:ETS-related transcription factor Elf-4-like [Mizuhopecten yessoensis]